MTITTETILGPAPSLANVGRTDCPRWCEAHPTWEGLDFEGVLHQRKVTFRDVSVTIEQTTDAPNSTDPIEPVVTVDVEWVSEQTIRNLAAVLTLAADLIGVPVEEVTR